MKIFFIFLSVILLCSITRAQTDIQGNDDEKYRWLYEKIFLAADRQELPNETFKSFRVHLKDSYQTFPDPELIRARNLKPVSTIRGTIAYVSIVKKKYFFDVLTATDGSLIVNVRVHFKNPTPQDILDFTEKVQQAEDIWNAGRVVTDFSYRFKFDIVADEGQAHFSVRILDSTRGPYDQFWSRDWIGNTLAHEIGHMMGLGDEYQTLTGKFDCFKPSIMCTAWTGHMMPHHYYFILRRLISPDVQDKSLN